MAERSRLEIPAVVTSLVAAKSIPPNVMEFYRILGYSGEWHTLLAAGLVNLPISDLISIRNRPVISHQGVNDYYCSRMPAETRNKGMRYRSLLRSD